MKYTLLGYRPFDFKDKDSGRQVEGVSLFTAYLEDGVTGSASAKLSVKAVPENIRDYIGCEIDVQFDQRGRAVQVNYPVATKVK